MDLEQAFGTVLTIIRPLRAGRIAIRRENPPFA